MKHEKIFRALMSKLYEPWMDEEDRKNFDAEIMHEFGAEMDNAIEAGIAKGFSLEQQEQAINLVLGVRCRV